MSDMSINDWIDKREMKGLPTFSLKDVRAEFPELAQASIINELSRLNKKKRIQPVHRGFYTAVPLQYKDRGIVPPYNYIDQLMRHMGKPYYISLLSAGVLHGAAHQQPQKLSITTVAPRISFSPDYNSQLMWNYRKNIPVNLLIETQSDTGTILYSNPELTCIDLVQYSQSIGGLSTAATVIEELCEKTDFERYANELLDITTLPTLQRLGFILDEILGNKAQGDSIYNLLKPYASTLKYRPLSTDNTTDGSEKNSRWKIIINKEIEPDEW